MADLDRDLQSIQEVRTLLRRAAAAQKQLEQFDQATIDRITKAMVDAGARAAEALARLAVEETGYGRVDSKTLKNLFGTEFLWESIKDLRTVGIVRRDDAAGIWEVAAPFGVVAGIIPTTNPTSTALYKAIISVKARNTIVMSPHPRSVRCVRETCRVLEEAAVRAGAPEGVVLCLSAPSLEATNELMRNSLTDVILATGGSALVKAAYSSGKPAYGVGPGNAPAYIERTADVVHAVRCIVASQTFDWGTICASEQAVIVDREIAGAVQEEFRRQGAHFCSEAEVKALEKICIRGELMNPEVVGQAPVKLAAMAGFRVPENTTVLLAPLEGVGPKYPLSREILTPLLAWYVVRDWREGCERAKQILEFGGDGHTLGLHTRSEEVVTAFALEKPSNRIILNAPTSQGAVGFATNLEASMTLGCGPMGRNISSDNITARHLVNLKRVAAIRSDFWDIAAKYASGRTGVTYPVAVSQHLVTPAPGSGAPRTRPSETHAPAPRSVQGAAGASRSERSYGGYSGNATYAIPGEAPAWSAAAGRPAAEIAPSSVATPAPVSAPSSGGGSHGHSHAPGAPHLCAKCAGEQPARPEAPRNAVQPNPSAVIAALLGKSGGASY
ncbi:MAG: aldehyde dehydrogenase family protein [Planctomycetes bacterium]|nr:aldehyde dehydrogenase family protein [Planctomycetota bacterium]